MMLSPVLVVILTMLYSPTVTIKSTAAPTLESLFVTCDNEMELFLDGVKYTDTAMTEFLKTSKVSIPPHTEVIAIYCKDLGRGEGVLGSTTTGIVTDGSWKCSSVKEDNWMMSDFDDSAWNNADNSRGVNKNNSYHKRDWPKIANNAYWIWATGYPTKTTEAYCRKSIARCIDTGCKKTGLAEDVETNCVYLKNVKWPSISHIYNVSAPWKEGLCKGADSEEDCCKCLPRLPVGCVDVKDACKDAFGGLGVCKNFVKDDMSAIDFEQGSKKHLCNVDKPDCCECFSLKKTKTTKP